VTIDHAFVNADDPCTPPTECNPPCDDNHVCILTEKAYSKCPERTCQPKNNPTCTTCPTADCPVCNSTTECWTQKNFCYNCGGAYCVTSPQ
ncbi:9850_t:CDS:2, partial [Dentiscutata erythropus]